MPDFAYTALTRAGIEVHGNEVADSLDTLTRQLKRQQLTLLHAKTRKAQRIPLAVLQSFVAELAPLVNRGVPLEKSLAIIAEDTGEPKVAAFAETLRKSIKRGESFSQALANSGDVDTLMIALVRVGESGGDLGQVLTILEAHYQETRQVRRDLVASLTYPFILALVALSSIIGLALYVVPVFRDIFDESAQAALPLGTRILFTGSEFLIQWGWLAGLILAGLVTAAVLFVQRSDIGQYQWHRLVLYFPWVGALKGRFEGFKLAKALSIMLERGVPLTQAADIARPLLTNRLQAEGFDACVKALRKGEPIPQAFTRVPGLPVLFHRYVKLGNETGTLGESLGKASERLREDFRTRLKSFVAILDPLIIVTMGGVVAFMVISILLAVFSLSDVK
jgi:general secretion pathway protein F